MAGKAVRSACCLLQGDKTEGKDLFHLFIGLMCCVTMLQVTACEITRLCTSCVGGIGSSESIFLSL